MHFQEGFAVFGRIALGQHVGWQLALLAEQHQRLVQLIGQYRTDQEATGVHRADVGEVSLDITVGEAVHHQAQGRGRLEQRGDVAKDHTRFREVDDRADEGFDVEGVEDHRRGVLAGLQTTQYNGG
ncbi:hypothetical protein D9M71_204250 [compost metagenome]